MLRSHLLVRLTALGAATALLLAVLLLVPESAPITAAQVIDPQVYEDLRDSADGQSTFIVVFSERADVAAAAKIQDWSSRGQYVTGRLRGVAERSQRGLRARRARGDLSGRVSRFQPFWIANVIVITGDRAAAEALAREPGVEAILPEFKPDPPEPPDTFAAVAPEAIPYGITTINADEVWALGYRGQGIVVGGVDTGVQWDHPALKAQYRGWNGIGADHNYNWWDPGRQCSPTGDIPCDNDGHGTHTTGTQVGDAPDWPIGVAPDATWIHALGCCPDNAALLSALEWMAAPTDLNGNNPEPSKRPQVVNNSWGGPGGSKIFYQAIDNLRAAGIVPVFSAGNNGADGCGTLGSPGDNTTSFNVGATVSGDGIAFFSSRGPNPFSGQPGPSVSAPGHAILSSIPGNAYSSLSGTSMAAPHVTGAIALILSAEPDLIGHVDQIEELLRKTALPLTSSQSCGGVPGSQVPNSTFGWGRIDVLAAVNMVLNAGTLGGIVTDGVTGAPIEGATVSVTRLGDTLTQKTGTAGDYSFVVGAGTYEMDVVAPGYARRSVASANVVQDNATTEDLALDPLELGSITGTVTPSGNPGQPVAGATVQLFPAGTSTATDANGVYTFSSVPFGSHTVRVRTAGYEYLSSAITVDGVESLDFAPQTVVDYVVGDGGDTCSAEYEWIDAAAGGFEYNLTDDASVALTLPWQFWFYGNPYTSVFVSANGYLSFGQGFGTWHGMVPFEGPPNNQIIALGEDLNPAAGLQGKIYARDLGGGRFVIQYDAVEHWPNGNPETFEIILNSADSSIVVQYRTVSWPDFANAGIENGNGTRGLVYSYSYNNSLRYTDPSGHCPMCITAGIGAIIGAGIAYVPQVAANINRDGWSFQALTTNIDMGAVGRGALTGGLAGATAFVAAPFAVAAAGELVAGVGVAVGSTTVLAAGLEAQYAAGSLSNAVHGAAIVGLTEPTDYSAVVVAGQRSQALQQALPGGSRGRTTMAVGIVEDSSGIRQTIVGTSERNGYLRPGARAIVEENKWTVANGSSLHAEQNVVQFAQKGNYRVIAVAAGRPICSSCASCIENAGGIIAGPMRMK